MLYENSGGILTHYADKYSAYTAISQRYPVKTTIARDGIDPRLPFFMANDNINVNARVMNSKYVGLNVSDRRLRVGKSTVCIHE